MDDPEKKTLPDAEALISRLRERARNLYLTRQMLCTEAVLASINHGLGGGLTDVQTTAMAAPFCVALGESGCLCGALSGAVMASGLMLGDRQPYRRRRTLRDSGRRLHDDFKAAHGATCCRVLIRNVKDDPDAHFRQCADLTADATEMAARLILERRPELARQADRQFLSRRQTLIGGLFNRLTRLITG